MSICPREQIHLITNKEASTSDFENIYQNVFKEIIEKDLDPKILKTKSQMHEELQDFAQNGIDDGIEGDWKVRKQDQRKELKTD